MRCVASLNNSVGGSISPPGPRRSNTSIIPTDFFVRRRRRQELGLGMHTTSSGNLLLSSIWRVFSSRSPELTNAIIDVWSILLAILLGFFTAVLLARELRPTWMLGFYLSLGGRREVPDVALCADPPSLSLSLSLAGPARLPFFLVEIIDWLSAPSLSSLPSHWQDPKMALTSLAELCHFEFQKDWGSISAMVASWRL
jgi:hypothetical protein